MFEIGASLREARLRRGLSAGDVERELRIRERYLRALEEEQWELLPGEAYAKGFLRTYAEFLGLDGQVYVDEYESRFVAEAFVDAPARRRSTRRQRELSFERRAIVLALVGMAALAALVIVAWKFGGSSPSAPSVLPPPAAAPKGLRFTGPGTYIEVRRGSASGSVLYAGTLRAGESNLVTGEKFWILIRHPSALRMTLDGKAVSLPARKTLKVVVTPSRTALAG